MYEVQLQSLGLTANQAKVYEALASSGSLAASQLMRRTGIERSLVYVVLNDLIDFGLASRDDSKKVARFTATHPRKLADLVESRRSAYENANSAFETVFHQLQQQYEIQSGQPGVRFFAGIEGLKRLYKQTNEARPDTIYLIRSVHAETSKEAMAIIDTQIEKQIRAGIKVKVVSPSLPILKKLIHKDKERLTERRILAKEIFNTPSQILIYNSVVAITTYREPAITTVIEHADIAETMLVIFNYIWKQSYSETEMHTKKLFSAK